MPSIKRANVAAGTVNDVDGLQFQDIPEPGALVSIAASTPTAGANIDFSVGTERFLVAAACNIELSADVVQRQEDLILDREPVPPGKMFLAVNAQIVNYLIIIEDLPSG